MNFQRKVKRPSARSHPAPGSPVPLALYESVFAKFNGAPKTRTTAAGSK
jgi:hypothetical protein